jgi:hypothetical protein
MLKFESLKKWKISCSQGNFDLVGALDYDVADAGKVEGVNTVGFKTPQGVMISPGGYTLGFTLKAADEKKQVDFFKLKIGQEFFVLSSRYGSSKKGWQFNDCIVSSLSFSGDGDGKNEIKLEVYALEILPL